MHQKGNHYINPAKWPIPRLNFRAGYFISGKYSISLGWDHMKYVAADIQTVKMQGYQLYPGKSL